MQAESLKLLAKSFKQDLQFCYNNIVGAVSQGRSSFLGVAAIGCLDDLYLYFQVGREVDLVLVPEHLVQF